MNVLKYSLLALVAILFISVFGIRFYYSYSVADYHGDVEISGLSADVTIKFDQFGIPQIYGETDADIWTGLGWAHASERLFQMEVVRRVMRGRLSEIFGPRALVIDSVHVKLGFRRKAEREIKDVSDSAMHLVKAYVNGVNHWIDQASVRPFEFELLGLQPEPWSATDVLGVMIYQTWYSHDLIDRDSIYMAMMHDLQDDSLLLEYEPDAFSTVPSSFLKSLFSGQRHPMRGTLASNSWAVRPEKSASGKAIHASDPHLAVNMVPNFWYLAGIHSNEGSDFVGATFPGMPIGVMGHTKHISYAFTVSTVDVLDHFIARRIGRDSVSIFGKTEALRRSAEDIPLGGEGVHIQWRMETSLGPVMEVTDSTVLIIKWTGFDQNYAQPLENITQLHKARDFDQFRRIVTASGSLDANWVYTDRNGNIGYQLGTPIPKRSYRNTFSTVSADELRNQWQGYVPLDSTPHVLNPVEGFVSSSNNRIVPEDWPYPLPGFYQTERHRRVRQELTSRKTHSVADFQQMHMNVVSDLARRWKSLMIHDRLPLESSSQIQEWDCDYRSNPMVGARFLLWWNQLLRVTFEDELGDRWSEAMPLLKRILQDEHHRWFDDTRTTEIETRAEMSYLALQAADSLQGGRDIRALHQLRISHLMAAEDNSISTILDALFDLNRGPFGMPSDDAAINVSYYIWDDATHTFQSRVAASMRFVLDWSQPDNFQILTNLGQSGNPFSPHYDDLLDLWLTGRYVTVPISASAVNAITVSTLRLKVAK